jgi:microcystin-dependent protein
MTLYKWSQTASADATADTTINWTEGQSPSSVNDSARAMMAAIAKYRDDVSGAIVTSGTNTSYAVNTYQAFQTLSQLNGQVIAFTPHATNAATVTINVDGLGARPLRSAPSAELPAGTVVQGTPYAALYNSSDAAFYLVGFFNNPYNVPIGSCIDFFGATAPNSSFVLAYGQAISRTAYSTLFATFGTTYGVGDGSTTFNIPDLRGRVVAGKDDMGGNAAGRIGSVVTDTGTIVGSALGSAGGSSTHILTISELPAHTHANILNDPGHTHVTNAAVLTSGLQFGGNVGAAAAGASNSSATTGITLTNASTGSGNGHAILQPTIVASKLIRII